MPSLLAGCVLKFKRRSLSRLYDAVVKPKKRPKSFTLGGYMPFGISDLTVNDNGATGVVYFNKNLVADLQIGDLYQLVRDDESQKMLDIILNARIYDVAIFCDFANFPNTLIFVTGKQYALSGIRQTSDIVSFYRERKSSSLRLLRTLKNTIYEWNAH